MIFKKPAHKQGIIKKNINEDLKKGQMVYILLEKNNNIDVSVSPTSKTYTISKDSVHIF
jgi:hypothetical protein